MSPPLESDMTKAEDTPGLPLPIAGDTRVYAIIGDPIAQVGSPLIFNAAFRRLGRKAVLIPLHVTSDDLPALMAGLRGMRNLDGIIVTVPHKMAVLDHIDRVETNGRRVGAVNAIRCDPDGTWVADNFDGRGCLVGLEKAGHDIAGRRVLQVGAGGAGCAVAHALADAGIGAIRIHDLDDGRRDRLVESLRAAHPDLAAEAGPPEPEGFDMVVNCSPLGMNPADPLPVAVDRLAAGTLVVDVILKPPVSPFLQAAAARGLAVQPGPRMLEGQAESILRFFGMGADS